MLTLSCRPLMAAELVYNPTNPSFGGNPLNGSYLLSNAQAQNDFKDPDVEEALANQRTALERFSDSLESRLLNQLLNDIEDGGSGQLVTDSFFIDVEQDTLGSLTVNITDRQTGETSEIVVSPIEIQ
ncbi:curli assembly protein CsgF [Marinobacterium jannaschii]|uniref:curli assembly protein CsgF n=1 Tax=Marinobacterium jannaschii TaxID=64970 RepID=UPI0004867764|nr:curli assembly protein CsgF [Marinobacterium jannaschii]